MGAGGAARAGPLVPPRSWPRFPRMLLGCQRLSGHPAQMGGMPPVTPKPLGSSLRNKLKSLQHSGNQKAAASQKMLFCPLGLAGSKRACAVPWGGEGTADLRRLASWQWTPRGSIASLGTWWSCVGPDGPASPTGVRSARPHPHRTYPGGQALLAVQADSTLVGDLGEVFILKLLEADVVGEPGGNGDGAITHCAGGGQEGAGQLAACGQGVALPAPGQALPVFTGKKD